MKSRAETDAGGSAAGTQATRQLNRGISATWWYTVSAIAMFEALIVLVWLVPILEAGLPAVALLTVGIGGMLWALSTVPLMLDYRRRTPSRPLLAWPRSLGPLIVAVVFGSVAVVVTGSWLIALLPLLQTLMLLTWPRGVRFRAVVVVTFLLGCAWIIDARGTFAADGTLEGASVALFGFYSTFLPAMTVLSLWWWDVLATLDVARASEARLAATQERLRIATDVHDLQGHHLQVIALHLELTEKLMARDPAAALETLRTARASVDEARQGTRDLAMRFRSVPLGDEIANARDLLRAAGIATEAVIGAGVDRAPGVALGPVIRETTTNVLRHGGGKRARLLLERVGDVWRYEISNDGFGGELSGGSGLEGIERRVSEVGGRLEVLRDEDNFTVIVMIPIESERAK